jgi:hypothetical protein
MKSKAAPCGLQVKLPDAIAHVRPTWADLVEGA